MLDLVGDRLAQRRRAVDGGVFGLSAIDGGLRRLLDVIGRVEIGLAGHEAEHVAALRGELGDLAVQDDCRGGLHSAEAFSALEHVHQS